MHYTGMAKHFKLIETLKTKEMRQLPLLALARLQQMFFHEKLTQLNGKTVINSFFPPFPSPSFARLGLSVQALLRKEIIPISCYISITNKCNFKCWHCSKAFRNNEDLSLETIQRTIEDLLDLGIAIVGFTGGEPLLRGDLEPIIRKIGSRATTYLFTTGDGLTSQRAQTLKESGLFGVAISLDSSHKEIHNKLRGRTDAFDIALRAVETSLNNGFYTIIQVVARKDFINNDMTQYIEFAKQLGVHEIRIIEPMPTGHLVNASDCLLTPEERERLKQVHIAVNERKDYPTIASFAYIEDESMYGCGAGVQHMHIDAQGNVCPCDFTPLSFGNIKKESLSVIWARLRAAFNRPRCGCFLLENSALVKDAFKGNLPLDKETSSLLCQKCNKSKLPRYYRLLGWN